MVLSPLNLGIVDCLLLLVGMIDWGVLVVMLGVLEIGMVDVMWGWDWISHLDRLGWLLENHVGALGWSLGLVV